jgi:hypothetical protein
MKDLRIRFGLGKIGQEIFDLRFDHINEQKQKKSANDGTNPTMVSSKTVMVLEINSWKTTAYSRLFYCCKISRISCSIWLEQLVSMPTLKRRSCKRAPFFMPSILAKLPKP